MVTCSVEAHRPYSTRLHCVHVGPLGLGRIMRGVTVCYRLVV